MYYVLYSILYLLSLLPLFVLHAISSFVSFVLFRLVGYRKKVVYQNLHIAFPEKTNQERQKIARLFYRNFTDTFIETVKLLSMSKADIFRHARIDMAPIKKLAAAGKSIQVHSGHQMNWELGHQAMARQVQLPWVGVYMRINNKVMERLFLKIRSVGSTVLVPAQEFKSRTHNLFKNQYAIGLIADQNPGVPERGYWLNFFNEPVAFVPGPDKNARLSNTAVVFAETIIVKRGVYQYNFKIITDNAAEMPEGELTRMYRDHLEEVIRRQPDNYLWSHKRWKWSFEEKYKKRWIDKSPPPAV